MEKRERVKSRIAALVPGNYNRRISLLFAVGMLGSVATLAQETVSNIFAAAESGNVKLVRALVSSLPESVNQQDRYGMTPLHYAAGNNQKHTVMYLMSHGASLSVNDNRGWTALHHAAEYGCEEIAALLVTNGASINAVNLMNWTPLHQASLRGHRRMVVYLIGQGADVSVRNSRQETPYNLAVDNGHLAIRDYLVAEMGRPRSVKAKIRLVGAASDLSDAWETISRSGALCPKS